VTKRPIDDLVRIAAVGGGFTIRGADYRLEELLRIANAAQGTGGRIHLLDMAGWPTSDLVKIALAGGGAVTFEL
jgi:hypothetical protein